MGGFSGAANARPTVDDSTIEYNGNQLRQKAAGTSFNSLSTQAKSVSLNFGYGGATTISNTALYTACGAQHNDVAIGSTEDNVGAMCPVTGNIDEIHIRVAVAVTAGHSFLATLYINGSPSATVIATVVNGDSTNLVSVTGLTQAVTKGDRLTVQLVKDTSGAQALRPLGFIRIIPTAA